MTAHNVFHINDFVKTVQGVLDLETTRNILTDLVRVNAFPGDHDLLIDVRQATCKLAPFELFHLVEEVIRHREFLQTKVALLVQEDQHVQAEDMELFAQNRGLQFRHFFDFEDALRWLSKTVD